MGRKKFCIHCNEVLPPRHPYTLCDPCYGKHVAEKPPLRCMHCNELLPEGHFHSHCDPCFKNLFEKSCSKCKTPFCMTLTVEEPLCPDCLKKARAKPKPNGPLVDDEGYQRVRRR